MITARNYLEVYPYDKWSDKELPVYRSVHTARYGSQFYSAHTVLSDEPHAQLIRVQHNGSLRPASSQNNGPY